MIFIVIFSLLFRITGIDVPNTGPEAEYTDVNRYVLFFLQIFRNSVGDVKVPDYSFWNERLTQDSAISNFMIYYSWLLWFANILFILIILLNFLIAIISQSYDSVIAKSTQVIYQNRAEFVAECSLLISSVQRGMQTEASTFTLIANIEKDTGIIQEFSGFVRPIKQYLKYNANVIKEQIK